MWKAVRVVPCGSQEKRHQLARDHEFSSFVRISAFVTTAKPHQMASASSARWGLAKVRRRGGASLTASEASRPSNATAKWYSGVVAASRIAFAHGMNMQPNKRLGSDPDILG